MRTTRFVQVVLCIGVMAALAIGQQSTITDNARFHT
jgi:hypothetical protein